MLIDSGTNFKLVALYGRGVKLNQTHGQNSKQPFGRGPNRMTIHWTMDLYFFF